MSYLERMRSGALVEMETWGCLADDNVGHQGKLKSLIGGHPKESLHVLRIKKP